MYLKIKLEDLELEDISLLLLSLLFLYKASHSHQLLGSRMAEILEGEKRVVTGPPQGRVERAVASA